MRSMSRAVLAAGVVLAVGGAAVAAGVWVADGRPSPTPAVEVPQALTGAAEPALVGRLARPVVLPPPGAVFDYQLGGAYPSVPGTRVVTRDRTAGPAAGLYNICYVNAFQTQPQESPWWASHAPDLLVRDRAGRLVQDPGWPGEYLLDTSTTAKRGRLAVIVGGWLDGCARSRFSAVEADNLDSWTRSKGALSQEGNVAFVRVLTARAHRDGLAFGQKNASELAGQGRSLGFDFAVAEECHAYDECGAYTAAYGRRVLSVEYTDNGGTDAFHRACTTDHTRMSMVLRDRNLTTPGDPSYVHELC